jgi:hypothetical protein
MADVKETSDVSVTKQDHEPTNANDQQVAALKEVAKEKLAMNGGSAKDDVTEESNDVTTKDDDVNEESNDVTTKDDDVNEESNDVTTKDDDVNEESNDVTTKDDDVAEESNDVTIGM